jgi:hypothetical protein
MVLELINQLVELEKSIDVLSKSVPEQVKTFNSAISELQEEMKRNVVTQGGGIVDDSMDPDKSVINQRS